MKALVICPDRPSGLHFMARKAPVALAPALGPSLLQHTLHDLAEAGAKQVTVLASDRPELVRAAVGRGERWGLQIDVIPESRELTIAEARKKYRTENADDWLAEGGDVKIADSHPDTDGAKLLAGPREWIESLRAILEKAARHRVGTREISPGVWAGLRCRIEPGVRLNGPCWLGEDVWVRSGAIVGPDAIIEDMTVVDHDSEVTASWVGPRTYVGAMTHVNRSLAWGRGLLNCDSGSFVEVPDAFLLGDLDTGQPHTRGSWLGRLAALGAAVFTSPIALLGRLRGGVKADRALVAGREVPYSTLPGLRGLWQRWPQLWNIVRGEFAWVGNRPLTSAQASELVGEFEQLWLEAPVGFVSLADMEGASEPFGDEARIHSSFYAAQAGPKLDRRILAYALRRAWHDLISSNP